MSGIGEAVYVYLQTVSEVTDLVSTRGYPGNLPKKPTLPAFTYAVISQASDASLQGSTGYVASRVQIDAYAAEDGDAAELATQIRLAMLAQPPPAMNGVEVDVVTKDGGFSRSEQPKDGSDAWRHRHSQDFRIGHEETIPS